MTDRTLAAKLTSISLKLISLDRRLSRIPRPTAASLAQTGDVKLTARSTVQAGWLAANGTLLDSDDYPALYAAIGTDWNTGGEAAGMFRTPNLSASAPLAGLVYIIKT
jgi:hypothetical protein